MLGFPLENSFVGSGVFFLFPTSVVEIRATRQITKVTVSDFTTNDHSKAVGNSEHE